MFTRLMNKKMEWFRYSEVLVRVIIESSKELQFRESEPFIVRGISHKRCHVVFTCLVISCDDFIGGLPIATTKERQAKKSYTPL